MFFWLLQRCPTVSIWLEAWSINSELVGRGEAVGSMYLKKKKVAQQPTAALDPPSRTIQIVRVGRHHRQVRVQTARK